MRGLFPEGAIHTALMNGLQGHGHSTGQIQGQLPFTMGISAGGSQWVPGGLEKPQSVAYTATYALGSSNLMFFPLNSFH